MQTPWIIVSQGAEGWLGFFFQAAAGLLLFFLEYTGKFNIPYSKFRRGGGLNPRVAMLLIYASPIPVYLFYYWLYGPLSLYHVVLFYAFVFHFGKRCMESLFLHRYSKPMSWTPVLIVGFAYMNVGGLAGAVHGKILAPAGENISHSILFAVGLVVFAAGEVLNFYHHILLSRLRKPGDTSYAVPSGGLFNLVASPHYLAELIAWTGYAMMSRFLAMYGILFIFICYLTARAVRTSAWYRENVPGYPTDRKAILPFLL